MPNNNVQGTNQFGQHPYGDIKKMRELAGSAPMSGAPTAGRAIDAARRAQRTAVAGGNKGAPPPTAAAGTPPGAPPALPVQGLPGNSNQQLAAQRALVWRDLANTPGASDLVKAYAQQAQQEATVG